MEAPGSLECAGSDLFSDPKAFKRGRLEKISFSLLGVFAGEDAEDTCFGGSLTFDSKISPSGFVLVREEATVIIF